MRCCWQLLCYGIKSIKSNIRHATHSLSFQSCLLSVFLFLFLILLPFSFPSDVPSFSLPLFFISFLIFLSTVVVGFFFGGGYCVVFIYLFLNGKWNWFISCLRCLTLVRLTEPIFPVSSCAACVRFLFCLFQVWQWIWLQWTCGGTDCLHGQSGLILGSVMDCLCFAKFWERSWSLPLVEVKISCVGHVETRGGCSFILWSELRSILQEILTANSAT